MMDGALKDMNAKRGALCQTQSFLVKLHSHDVVSGNTLIARYAQDGKAMAEKGRRTEVGKMKRGMEFVLESQSYRESINCCTVNSSTSNGFGILVRVVDSIGGGDGFNPCFARFCL